MIPNARIRIRIRTRTRGAAMIEAIVVISVLLVFMGLIVWMRQAYGTKLDLQQRTRAETLYFASHACQGDGKTTLGGAVPGDSGPAANTAEKTKLPEGAALNRNWNNATGTLEKTVDGQAVWDQNARGNEAPIEYGKHALTSQVTASSTVTCNEKKYDSKLSALFGTGVDVLKSGADPRGIFQ